MKKLADLVELRPSQLLGAILVGGGLGLGARGLRYMSDLYGGTDTQPPYPLPKPASNRVKVPMPVSSQEMSELEASGVPVRHITKSAATLVDNLLMGLAGTGAAVGGWKLLDNHLDNQRRMAAQKKLDAVRLRVSGLLDDSPLSQDIPLHAQMKAAEDAYFSKKASLGDILASIAGKAGVGVANIFSPMGYPLAIGGTLLGLSAFNQTVGQNKYRQGAKEISDFARSRAARPPEAEVEPVYEEEEKNPVDATVVDSSSPELPDGQIKAANVGSRLKERLRGGLPR